MSEFEGGTYSMDALKLIASDSLKAEVPQFSIGDLSLIHILVRQLYGVLSVGLDTSQIVVTVAMHQLCIDDGNI